MRRWLRYRLIIPVFRSPHSPEYTARGVANGVFWAVTPLIGLQTAAILATWFVGRKALGKDSSLLQAFIWAWVNNPVTMIPMYYAFYRTGLWITGDAGAAAGYDGFVGLWNATANADWMTRVVALARSVGLPTLVGCTPYAIASGALSYWWAVSILRRRRQRLIRRRLAIASDPAPDAPPG